MQEFEEDEESLIDDPDYPFLEEEDDEDEY